MSRRRGASLLAAVTAFGGCAGAPRAVVPAGENPTMRWTSIEVQGKSLAVFDPGPSDGRLTLLAVHGFGGSGLEFGPLAAELPPGVRLVAPDLPGTGRSQPAGDGQYGMELFVSVLRELVDRIGSEPVVLLGASLGGKIATVFATRYPEKVLALVLIAPYGLDRQEGVFRRVVASHRALAGIGAKLNNRMAIRTILRRRVYYDKRRIREPIAEHLIASQLSPSGRKALAAVASALIGPDPIDSLVPRVAHPSLLLWGREDRVLPSSAAARYAALMPRARLVLLDRCGHAPAAEKPAETARAIEAFLRDNRLLAE